MRQVSKVIKGYKVLIMGLTYKENVADTREAPTRELIKQLKEYGVKILGYGPLVDNIKDEFAIENVDSLEDIRDIDCIIVAVAHEAFSKITLDTIKKLTSNNPILIIDVKRIFREEEAKKKGFRYKALYPLSRQAYAQI